MYAWGFFFFFPTSKGKEPIFLFKRLRDVRVISLTKPTTALFLFSATGVLIGNTDTRYYLQFTHNVYRFSPTFMYPEDLPRFHGVNERISKKNYEQAINFYHHLILNADEASLPPLHQHGAEL